MSEQQHTFRAKVMGLLRFLTADIWRVNTSDEKGLRKFINNICRILILAARGFNNNKLVMVASGLTYFTLLSAVPLLCLLLAVAKGFSLQDMLTEELFNLFPSHSGILTTAFEIVEQVLQAATKGVVIGVGVFFIIWAIFSIINNIERAFNIIWNVPKSRAIYRKITDFFAAMLILPLMLIISNGISIYLKTNFANNEAWAALSPIINLAIKLAPYLLTCLLFSILYYIMPNTKVRIKNALVAGILTGTIFHIFQYMYISGQIWVNKYSAIYGSFAALPLLLLWIQATWMIVLLGGEITYASQNLHNFFFEKETQNVSFRYRSYFTIVLLRDICQAFEQGRSPYSAAELSNQHHIPLRLVQEQLAQLCDLHILSELNGPDKNCDLVYQPAIDIQQLNVAMVFEKLYTSGTEDFKLDPSEQTPAVWAEMKEIEKSLQQSEGHKLIKDL